MLIATGFYSGYLPKAPGTWGSLVAFPIHLLICRLAPTTYAFVLTAIIILAIITAGSAEKIINRKDPGIIVIDEIAGMLIALIAVPTTPIAWLAAFALFRFFDINKPFPISWADKKINGGTGIVLDDLLAGLMALTVFHITRYLIF